MEIFNVIEILYIWVCCVNTIWHCILKIYNNEISWNFRRCLTFFFSVSLPVFFFSISLLPSHFLSFSSRTVLKTSIEYNKESVCTISGRGGEVSGRCQGKLHVYVAGLLCNTCCRLTGVRQLSMQRSGLAEIWGYHLKGCQVWGVSVQAGWGGNFMEESMLAKTGY